MSLENLKWTWENGTKTQFFSLFKKMILVYFIIFLIVLFLVVWILVEKAFALWLSPGNDSGIVPGSESENNNTNNNPPIKIQTAIVCTTKKPIDFHIWLSYHLHVVGIDYIFLQIEDTPELASVIQPFASKLYITHTEVGDLPNQYHAIQDRQRLFTEEAIRKCQRMKIHFLVQMDDDELLYVSDKYNHRLDTLISKKKWHNNTVFHDFHFQNVEAIYASDANECFASDQFVDCKLDKCRSYANGKSMGRISKELVSRGCHYFNEPTLNIKKKDAMILHFDSCRFEKWKQKFLNLLNHDTLEEIPFPYYRDSINKIRECHQLCETSPHMCENCHSEMKALWKYYTSRVNNEHVHNIPHLATLLDKSTLC